MWAVEVRGVIGRAASARESDNPRGLPRSPSPSTTRHPTPGTRTPPTHYTMSADPSKPVVVDDAATAILRPKKR